MDFTWERWQEPIFEYGTVVALALGHIVLIVIAGWVALRALRRILRRLELMLIRRAEEDEDRLSSIASEKRVKTLVGLLHTVAAIGVWAMVVMTSLTAIGVEVGPLLAGAGVAGLAFGFGAQNLVKDVIAGFFFIMENQVRVGDVAIVNGTGGIVEAITFRTITLRDLGCVVHIFPHGQISTLSNMTKGWSAYVVEMGVAYKEDTDEVVRLMKEVHAEMMKDPAYAPRMLQELEVFGVDRFDDSAVIIKARMKTEPLQQWFVGREFNRRIKKLFDAQGIEIPFPHRTVMFPKGISVVADATQNG